MRIERHERIEDGVSLPFVVLTPDEQRRSISSATLGGGFGTTDWVLNATVPTGYDRDDPADHLAELASSVGLAGTGVGLMTAVDVGQAVRATDRGVTVHATVGVNEPTWAATPSPEWHDASAPAPGTINLVVDLPVRLSDGALVNAVATATEAKCQAMAGAGLAGTGTPTDAVVVLCPLDGPAEAYGGPRSRWGSRVARAAHAAVAEGLAAWLAR